MKLYDGFLFNDELDLLELRLMELDSVVDRFVLVEMGHNFRCQPKPLHFKENRDRYARWLHKIEHVVVEGYPIEPHPVMEHFQRRCIARGVGGADLIVIGDVDEIPKASVLEGFKESPSNGPVSLMQRLYYYTVDFEQDSPWIGSVVSPAWKQMDCEAIRQMRGLYPRASDAGWHFSWLGSPEQLSAKLRAIDVDGDSKLYGTEDTIKAPDPDNLEFLRGCVETGADLFGRSPKRLVPIEAGVRQPRMIDVWLDRFPQYSALTRQTA